MAAPKLNKAGMFVLLRSFIARRNEAYAQKQKSLGNSVNARTSVPFVESKAAAKLR